jgi:hypothetical protein
VIGMDDDPLIWWSSHEISFPNLSLAAEYFLSIPATSVPCERIFSKAGLIYDKSRKLLSSNNLDKRIILTMNKNLLI